MPKSDKFIKLLFQTSQSFLGVLIVASLGLILIKPDKSAAPSAVISEIPEPPKTTTLFFAGDIMLSRNVFRKIDLAKNPTLPFQNVQVEVAHADIGFANLESPFNDTGKHFVEGSLIFNADPNTVAGLLSAGLDILATANNHSFDQGQKGLDFTQSLLENSGIAAIGTGEDCHQGLVMEKNGIKFGYLAYSYAAYNDGGRKPDTQVCDWNDLDQVTADIRTLKPQVDFLTVSSHMGTEYRREPEEINRQKARAALEVGADLFIGHHPHWIQTIENYGGKWIFYSLGNFVFDQMWSQDTREGLTVFLTFTEKEITKIELRPVIIEDYCCPRFANFDETTSILGKINLTSPILMNKN